MELFVWSDEFSVNIARIDEQHKKFFSIINQLQAGLNGKQSKKDLQDILSGLLEYAIHHFSAEEELLAKYHAPGLEEHMKEHEGFRKKVIQFIDAFLKAETDVALDMGVYLLSWLKTHVLLTDKKYSAFLNEHGVH